MTGALWAAASGIGFGLFQSLNRRALRDIDDAFVSTFLQLAIAAVVLSAACVARGDVDALADAPLGSIAAFAASGLVHFFLGWTFLNLSQQRIGAARTAPLLTFSPLFGLPVAAVAVGDLPSVAALVAILPMVAGAWLLAGGRGGQVRPADAVFGLGCALMWAVSPVFAVEGFEGIASPLLGVALGMVAAAAAYAVAMSGRGAGLGLAAIARGALGLKLAAALLVAFATWWRWIALGDASVAVVLALGLLSVPVVLFLAPVLVGGHLEQVTARVWAGAALVVGGALALIAVG